jgi:hypothetical protein
VEAKLFLPLIIMIVVAIALNDIAWGFFRRPEVDLVGPSYVMWHDLNNYLLPRGVVLAKAAKVVGSLVFITWAVEMVLKEAGWIS